MENGTENGDCDLLLEMDARQAAFVTRAVTHAAKTTGAEIILAGSKRGLRIHGVSSSKTACLDIDFRQQFFDSFRSVRDLHFGVHAKVSQTVNLY